MRISLLGDGDGGEYTEQSSAPLPRTALPVPWMRGGGLGGTDAALHAAASCV